MPTSFAVACAAQMSFADRLLEIRRALRGCHVTRAYAPFFVTRHASDFPTSSPVLVSTSHTVLFR